MASDHRSYDLDARIIVVGFQVPAKPLRFEHKGAHEDLSLPNHALSLTAISEPSSTNPQHKRHEIYTGSGHRCGVIPYSNVVWWIASWAEDEQLQGKNSLLRSGALVLGKFVWWPWRNGSGPR